MVAAALAFGLALINDNAARAELSPELQTQVNQILAAGGPDVVANLAALAGNNQSAADDILLAGCADGLNCLALANAIAEFTDAQTDARLRRVAQDFNARTRTGGGFGSLAIGLHGGQSTGENPGQTSGSEPGGGQ